MHIQKIAGRCLCGSVQYSSEAAPSKVAICHCESCQRQTGTAFSIVVCVPEDAVVFERSDSLDQYLSRGDSGGLVRRRFCQNCGSPILSTVESVPGICFIKAGTLNDKSWLKPTSHIWCSSAQPWLQIGDNLEKHDQNPA